MSSYLYTLRPALASLVDTVRPALASLVDTDIVSRQNGSYRPLGTCLPQSTSAANESTCFYFFFREEILLVCVPFVASLTTITYSSQDVWTS
ncbi:hypothetical protein QCA50_019552 [Cerrena zonata]|uniref:Uncharacterized protein n=1 Tax=Cerrena zonata TaxID=2478898 RepID=A0AAW0FH01_9APHY